jgi:hypothetical protein
LNGLASSRMRVLVVGRDRKMEEGENVVLELELLD